MKHYVNYHKHCHYSNIMSQDSHIKPIDYINRAKELGHEMVFSTQHGVVDGKYEYYNLCKENDLKFGFGVEAYWVEDRFEKNSDNNHIVLLAKSFKGMNSINKAISEANRSGKYYRPRIDFEIINQLDDKEVFVTTACIAFNKSGYETSEKLIKMLKNKFRDNFMLEIQAHHTDKQIEWNKFILKMSKKYGIELIAGVDSHYIYEYQDKERTAYLESKDIIYKDEEGWYMDYPDYNTLFERFVKQGIFTEEEIEKAIENTNICLGFEDITFNTDIKLPTIYPELSQREKDIKLWNIIMAEFKNRKDINKNKYLEEIKKEFKVIVDTKFSDYFLFNYEMIKLGKEKGGKLTKTSRGCFTKNAILQTDNSLKTIDKIKIGDLVLNKDGAFRPVLNKFEYDIEEDLIEFTYKKQGSSYKKYKNQCTLDHKILTKDGWKQAVDLEVGDLLCVPKIKAQDKEIVYDLAKYTDFEYDDKYVYEVFGNSKPYKHSPIKTLDDYGLTKRAIPRFIKMDKLTNMFVGAMYADGWTEKGKGLGFAINKTKKSGVNKHLFYSFAKKMGLDVFVREGNNRNLIQLYINSLTLNKWFKAEFFSSKKGTDKIFNKDLLKQSKENLYWLKKGMDICDGSKNQKEKSFSYGSTSLSIIGSYKIMNNILSKEPLAFDVNLGYTDKRGYSNSESYKLRKPIKKKGWNIKEDEDYWYLPVESIKIIKNFKGKVYDLHIQDEHNYTINNIVVHNSAPSWYVNNLLGFTTIDRVNAPVKMYPERFATVERILESKSLFDIDFNIADPKPFIKAQNELLGEDNAYYMVAYGKLKTKSAWKMYAKVNNIDFEIANNVSKQIEQYEKDLTHADEDEKDNINVYDYIDKEYHDIYDKSKIYHGIIDSISPSPCSFLLLNKNISEEIGLINVNKILCVSIDGYTAEKNGYMKNDLLTVTVVDIVNKAYEAIGIEPHSFPELIDITKNDKKTWDIYEKGATVCINQCESEQTTEKLKKYKPKNIGELADFVAVIRPGATSIVDDFLSRKQFKYGMKEIDELISSDFKQSSYILYQEEVMALLAYVGFEPHETYTILKGIAKKRPEVVDKAKDKFYAGLEAKKYNKDDIDKLWHVMELNASYSFNASHALSVAGDSLYEAYLKANYPYEFYNTILKIYTDKKNNDKVSLIKKEMKDFFGINVGDLAWGVDNRDFVIDKENGKINQALHSVKTINKDTAKILYDAYKVVGNDKFYKVIKYISNIKDEKGKKAINKTKIDTLCRIGYFKPFAKTKKIMDFIDKYRFLTERKTFKKEETPKWLEEILYLDSEVKNIEVEKNIKPEEIKDNMEIIKKNKKTYKVKYTKSQTIFKHCEDTDKLYKNLDLDYIFEKLWGKIPDEDLDFETKARYEYEYLGYIVSKIPDAYNIGTVIYTSKKRKSMLLKSMRNNKTVWFKVQKVCNKEDVIFFRTRDIKKYKGYNGKTEYKIKEYKIF